MENNLNNIQVQIPDYKKFGLTGKQAKCATYLLYGYSKADACRNAGYGGSNHVVYGYELSQHPKVIEYLNHLRSVTVFTYGISKNSLIEELLKIKDKAMEKGNFSAAISAIKTVANLVGYDNGGEPEKEVKRSDEESVKNNYNVVFLANGNNESKPSTEKIKLIADSEVIEHGEFIDKLNADRKSVV